jgi:hypothetical protein
MTIIASILLPTHVVQVSDRMLTWQIGKRVVRQEDTWNKATVFGDRAAIAYTGTARLPDQRTDQWITETLMNETDIGSAMKTLSVSANERLRLGQLKPTGLAVVFAGWSQRADTLLPAVGLVTNILTPIGTTTGPRNKFDVFSYESPADDLLGIHIAGQTMPTGSKRTLARAIKNAVKRGKSMAVVARLTIAAILDLKNPYVGRSYLAVVLPCPVPNRPNAGLIGALQTGPHPDAPCSYYFNDPKAAPIYIMPNVTGGGTAITDISVIPKALSADEIKARFAAGRPKPK